MNKRASSWIRLSLFALALLLMSWAGSGRPAQAGCHSYMATLNILGDWCGGAAGDCMIVSCPKI